MIVSVFGKRRDWGFWTWLFWGFALYLALELGPFFIAGWVLRRTARELAGSYLALAIPGAIMISLVWWLRRWEQRGAPPKRLAHGWGLSMAAFVVATAGALFYSGVELRLVDPADAVGDLAVAALFGALVGYFSVYHMVLPRISSRMAGGPAGPGHGA
jgi:hypothetical protein